MSVERLHEAALAALFEPCVAIACLEPASVDIAGHPYPDAWLDAASPARRREGYGGRVCAARALALLGEPATRIARGDAGEPVWPAGIVGSITHASQICGAVVARASEVRALGVDVEPDLPGSLAFAERVCGGAEQDAIRRLGASVPELARVIFSAKEALYKLQFPLTRGSVGLAGVEVILQPGSFTARFEQPLGPLLDGVALRGRWRRALGHIWTGAWLPVSAA